MRCKACNRKLESIQFYKRLGRHEDLCRKCFSAAASHAYDISPAAAVAMTGRLAGSVRVDPDEKPSEA